MVTKPDEVETVASTDEASTDDAAATALAVIASAGADPGDEAMRDALGRMADLEVTVLALDGILPVDDPEPDAVERANAWAARLLAVAETPGAVALCHWVAAIVAERSGDVLAADGHLTLALEADPAFPPAIDWCAYYASDRGDAATAVGLWRRLSEPNPGNLRVLEPHLHRGGRTPGRNERCWCGSGRKYKTCHNGEPAPISLPDRVGWLSLKAAGYAERRGGAVRERILSALAARAVDPDDDDSLDAAMDDPIVFDAVLCEGGWFSRFLEDRRPLLPDDEVALAERWLPVRRSVHEVVAVRPGAGLTVRDLRTGVAAQVREPIFSLRASPGQLVCGRVVPDGETHQFVGGLLPVLAGTEQAVLDLCADGTPEGICAWARTAALEG